MGRGQQGKGLRVFRPRVCAVHCAYSKVGEVIERRVPMIDPLEMVESEIRLLRSFTPAWMV